MEAGKSKTKMLADPKSGKVLLFSLQTAAFLLCFTGTRQRGKGEGERQALSGLFLQGH